jgi:hypothetical protein
MFFLRTPLFDADPLDFFSVGVSEGDDNPPQKTKEELEKEKAEKEKKDQEEKERFEK